VIRKTKNIKEDRICRIFYRIPVIILSVLFSLTGPVVRGQQSYIPFSDPAGSDSGTVSRPDSEPKRRKQAGPDSARVSESSSAAVSARPPLPNQLQPATPGPIANSPNKGRFASPTDWQAIQAQVAAETPAPPAETTAGITGSAINATVPIEPPPVPTSPLPPGYVPGVTSVPLAPPGIFNSEVKTYESFGSRLFKAYFGKKEQEEETESNYRTGVLAPFSSPPFPFTDHIGPVIGYKDTTEWPLMEAVYAGPNADWWKKNRIKIYGWADPSVTFGTSKNSNVPLSYAIVPNSLQLSQAILIFERVTDSVQTDHVDWGFKFTSLYGIDYRYTTAKGYFSDQLLKHNNLYGYDPLQMYVDIYIPWVREGMIIRAGRYISPIDIEAQLSPENYLYTHSVMYTYDPYTFTGVQFITKLNKRFTLMLGVQAGNDMAPWTTSSQPNGEFLLKWVSESGKDSLFGGVDSVGKGYFLNGHDDIQICSLVWTHKFTDKFHTLTEAYYDWERDALAGGSVTNGPSYPYFPFVGPGKYLPGLSDAFGCVNYTAYQTSDKSFICLRNDVLVDPRGWRTGFAGTYFEQTLGWVYHITPWCVSRPEVRFDYTTGQLAYDNGTKRDQFTFNWDIIIRF
jgi:hypothetical protein